MNKLKNLEPLILAYNAWVVGKEEGLNSEMDAIPKVRTGVIKGIHSRNSDHWLMINGRTNGSKA